MARRFRPLGAPPRRLPSPQRRRGGGMQPPRPPKLNVRVGYPAGCIHPDRKHLALQANGLLDDEHSED